MTDNGHGDAHRRKPPYCAKSRHYDAEFSITAAFFPRQRHQHGNRCAASGSRLVHL